MTVTRRSFVAACVVGVSLAFPAYNAWAQNYPASVKELVAKTRKEVKTTDMAGFKQVLDRKDVVIVDVREPEEFKAGHVPGAVNVPRGLLDGEADVPVLQDRRSLHARGQDAAGPRVQERHRRRDGLGRLGQGRQLGCEMTGRAGAGREAAPARVSSRREWSTT